MLFASKKPYYTFLGPRSWVGMRLGFLNHYEPTIILSICSLILISGSFIMGYRLGTENAFGGPTSNGMIGEESANILKRK